MPPIRNTSSDTKHIPHAQLKNSTPNHPGLPRNTICLANPPHATSGDFPTQGGGVNKSQHPTTQIDPPSTSSSHLLQPDTNTPTNNPILALWQHALVPLTPEAFTTFTKAQEQTETPPCPDPSGFSDLIPIKVSHFTYGEWKSVHDVHTCLQGLHKLLNMNLTPPLLFQPGLDQILSNGLPPSMWTSTRYFGPTQKNHGTLHCTRNVWCLAQWG